MGSPLVSLLVVDLSSTKINQEDLVNDLTGYFDDLLVRTFTWSAGEASEIP